jgi:hypothetical protein
MLTNPREHFNRTRVEERTAIMAETTGRGSGGEGLKEAHGRIRELGRGR